MDKTLVNAGRMRFAAEILVATWDERGRPPAEYDLVWKAKEYLYDAADEAERHVIG